MGAVDEIDVGCSSVAETNFACSSISRFDMSMVPAAERAYFAHSDSAGEAASQSCLGSDRRCAGSAILAEDFLRKLLCLALPTTWQSLSYRAL